MRTLIACAAILTCQPCVAQTSPYWTPIDHCGDIPKDRYGSSYGFAMDTLKPVVTKRYVYPVTVPMLFAGDTIVSIKGQAVSSSKHAQSLLDASKSPKITIKVSRAYADGTKREFNVAVTRSVYAKMETACNIALCEVTQPLTSLNLESFGKFACYAEYVGSVTDPETGEPADAFKLQGGVKPPRELKAVATRLGTFILRDRRVDTSQQLVTANFPHDQWKRGELVEISECCVMIAPSFEADIDGRTTDVKVLSVFNAMMASEPIKSSSPKAVSQR